MPLLQVRGLEKWYGRRQVVNGVDYDVDRGEVVGLLGPNGAGKTTSFRMTIGLIDSDGGKVMFDGRDVTRLPMYLRAKAGMGYLAQDRSVFRQLSVEDNLMAILETRKDMTRKQRKDRQEELLDQFGLTKIRKTKADRVSGGEGRRLEIARSLITEPKLIMLDEPFAGIDPKTVAEIQDQIRDLVERYNIGILLTDHQFRETLEVTDRCYLIREGRVFAYGNREQIFNNPEVRRHYIGERFDVGHLLERRRPVSLSHQQARDGSRSVRIPDASGPEYRLRVHAAAHLRPVAVHRSRARLRDRGIRGRSDLDPFRQLLDDRTVPGRCRADRRPVDDRHQRGRPSPGTPATGRARGGGLRRAESLSRGSEVGRSISSYAVDTSRCASGSAPIPNPTPGMPPGVRDDSC